MTAVYLDTNILLARWIKDDPYHLDRSLLVSAIEKGELTAYFSTFGLCEVTSVVKRQEQKFSYISKTSKEHSVVYIKKYEK
jgi:predicted nucleic acid-binding protein